MYVQRAFRCGSNINIVSKKYNIYQKVRKYNEQLYKKKDEISVSALIKEILEETGYLKELKNSKNPDDVSRVENLKELVSAAADFERESEDKSLGAFLEKQHWLQIQIIMMKIQIVLL